MVMRGHAPTGAAETGDAMNRLLFALPLFALAACSNEPEVKMENASMAEVAQEMREAGTATFLNPGKWQHTVTLLEMDVPGMPPEARSMMQQAMKKVQQYDHCLTPEQAKRPSEDFFAKAGQKCRYEHFNWGDGKIDLKLNCSAPQGRLTMVQTGEYQPDGFTMAVTQIFESEVAGGPGQMTVKAKVDARRIGDCDGEDKAQVGN